jgi:23S rRNA (cytidine1920-2'-O)/16S rRNA (cytidine1409-2'-O)-methyltransferase
VSTGHYVSRAGDKLAHAISAFAITPTELICADLGSHVGGFVDCLLQRGAARVHSVDTSYGTLAWKLRKDPRVVVHERTNAMHVELPEPVDLITIDVGWTPQRLIIPHATSLLGHGGRIITLIKPHYESPRDRLVDGVLPRDDYDEIVGRVMATLESLDMTIVAHDASPIIGHGGNREHLALIQSKETQP